jgi:hypothetical protein
LVVGSIATLAACSDSPPGCADSQVTTLLRNSLVQDAFDYVQRGNQKAKRAELQLGGITTDGYDAAGRLHRCRGTLTIVRSQSGNPISTEVEYAVQGTEGKSGEFVVRVLGFRDVNFILHLRSASYDFSGG